MSLAQRNLILQRGLIFSSIWGPSQPDPPANYLVSTLVSIEMGLLLRRLLDAKAIPGLPLICERSADVIQFNPWQWTGHEDLSAKRAREHGSFRAQALTARTMA